MLTERGGSPRVTTEPGGNDLICERTAMSCSLVVKVRE